MNIKIFFFVFGVVIILFSCNTITDEKETEETPHSDIEVTHPIQKDLSVYKEFQGVTQFMQHLQIRAKSTGIITKTLVYSGNSIKENQPLFIVKSREATLLNGSSLKNTLLPQMADTIISVSSGQVDQTYVQQGDFVQQGDLLATSVNKNSMRILISVPLEENIALFLNKPCKIILPNGEVTNGTIEELLPIVNNSDQTNQLVVYPEVIQGLSENMHVRVKIKSQDIKNALLVPGNSIYANEELTKHWIYKVSSDSIAIKIPIHINISSDSLVQIINPDMSINDTIITKGGFGLPDTAYVSIIKTNNYEEK